MTNPLSNNYIYTPPTKTGDELTDQIEELMAYRQWQERVRLREKYWDMLSYMKNSATSSSQISFSLDYLKKNILNL